jgi:hypothetical protein
MAHLRAKPRPCDAQAKLKETPRVPAGDDIGIEGRDRPDLAIEHRHGDVAMREVVDPRRPAAESRVRPLDHLRARNRAEDLQRRPRHALGVEQVAGRS